MSRKISGLATILLILLGGVSSYFYFEINEISREIEEIGESDLPLYETTTQLILYQKEKQLLVEELNKTYYHFAKEQELYLSEIAHKFDRIELNINRTLLEGIKSFHQIAQMMGIVTIAEFVDSEEKLMQLKSLGIDYAQGYWIGKPQNLPILQSVEQKRVDLSVINKTSVI